MKRPFTNVLDLSAFGKSRVVFSNTAKISMQDIYPSPKIPDQNPKELLVSGQKTIFIIRENKISQPRRHLEMMRVMAGGIIILMMIHFINISARGQIVKDAVVTKAYSGFNSFMDGRKQVYQASFIKAEDAFSTAENHFKTAIDTIKFLYTDRSIFNASQDVLATAQNILMAGRNLAEAGVLFTKGMEHLREWPTLFLQKNDFLQKDKNNILQFSLTRELKKDLAFLEETKEKIKTAENDLRNVSISYISSMSGYEIGKVRLAIKQLLEILNKAESDIPVILKLLGDRQLHRYLILLQNSAEARPTGGFIGSVMLVDVYNGKIIKNTFHDVYEFDGQLSENIEAPEDIAKITKNWRLRDANYSPDFPISAEKAAWFLQKEKGPSVDTVIAVNQNILRDFFNITGPVQLEELEAPLTKDNYQLILSFIIESKLNGKNDPKKIMRNFIPVFQKKLFAVQKWNDILKIFARALLEKNILFYSRDLDIQTFFDEKGISGSVYNTKPGEDYLQIVHTAIGGNKSDAFIQQAIEHVTFIGQNGRVTDEITLTREHLWQEQQWLNFQKILKEFRFETPSESIRNILGKGDNRSSVKIYVPHGSVLVEADGMDKNNIFTREDEKLKKTYFLFEMTTTHGAKNSVRIKYRLPQNLELFTADSYKFFFQPQPAFRPSNLNKIIYLDNDVKNYDKYPSNLTMVNEKTFVFSQKEQKNMYLSILVGR